MPDCRMLFIIVAIVFVLDNVGSGGFTHFFFFFSSRRRHTRSYGDWSSDVCSSDLLERLKAQAWAKLSPHPLKDNTQGVAHDGIGALVDQDPELEYLSLHDLARRIDYAEGTIRNLMSQGVFKLGQHYVKPRGRILFKWTAIRNW